MKKTFFQKFIVCMALSWLAATALFANEYVVEIKNFDAKKGTFTLKTYGDKPYFSHIDFYNEFGATTGNTYNQIPGNKQATLDLYGWEGCTIDSVTFGMRSNKNTGNVQAKVELYDDNGAAAATLYDSGVKSFNSADWYGSWVRYSNLVTVDITKEMAVKRAIGEEYVTVTVTGGVSAGSSVYLDRLTIHYTPDAAVELEKALPYKFTQLGKNDALADGDVCILVNGSHIGACEIADEMATYPYMGTTAVGSYDEVYVPENNSFDYPALQFFEMSQKDGAWHMIDQYGDTLGCAGLKHMTYNQGTLTWNITLGATYDGHTIASTNAKYGAIQYNYTDPRFTTYNAGSQGKVFLCRRGAQQPEVLPTSLTLADTRDMTMCTDSVIMRPAFSPESVTDTRVAWKSLNPEVATVRDGIVRPVAIGTAKIVAISRADKDVTDTCEVVVAACTVEGVTIMDEKGKNPQHEAEMYVCQSTPVKLTVAIEPANAPIQTVRWESLDTAVVAVSNGKLTPVAVGKADVVATAIDGGKADTCHVTVLPCEIEKIYHKYPETDKEFTLKDCGGFDGNGERFQIFVGFEPEIITVTEDDFVWTSSDEAVAKIFGSVGEITQTVSATVHAIAPGKATLTIAAKHDETIKVESQVTVVSCGTAIGETRLMTIYSENGRIVVDGDYRIFTVTGIDVTEQNGQLEGIYMVRTSGGTYKIAVR